MPVKPPTFLCIIDAQLEMESDVMHWIGEVEHVQAGRRQRFVSTDDLLLVLRHLLDDELHHLRLANSPSSDQLSTE